MFQIINALIPNCSSCNACQPFIPCTIFEVPNCQCISVDQQSINFEWHDCIHKHDALMSNHFGIKVTDFSIQEFMTVSLPS